MPVTPRFTLSIRTKLALGYATAFALTVGIGTFSVVQLSAINTLARETREVWLPKLDMLNRIEERIKAERLAASKLVESTELHHLAAIGKEMTVLRNTIDTDIGRYAGSSRLYDDERDGLGAFQRSWATYLKTLNSIGNKLEVGDLLPAYDEFERVSLPPFNQSLDRLGQLKAIVTQSSRNAEERADLAFHLALRLTIGVSVLGALFGLAATSWNARSISRPIARISEAMQRLTRGDYDAEIVAGPPRRDEIGVLIDAVAGYRESLLRGRELAGIAERERQRLQDAISNMPVGLVMFDADRRLIICNPRYAEMYRLPPHLTVPGTPFNEIIQSRVRTGLFAVGNSKGAVADILAVTAKDKPAQLFVELNDGRCFSVIYQPLKGGGWVSTHEDITERRRNEQRIHHMSRHDALTDLPNRVLAKERIDHALGSLAGGENVAVLCVDLDRFKAVNDTLGHPTGDRLLQLVADRMREAVRDTDVAARFGGDEFAIIQTGAVQPQGATGLASRLIQSLAAPYQIGDHHIDIGCSIGIALAPADGDNADELIKKADLALYRAKLDGRGAYRFFEAEMDARMQARHALELDLRRALNAREFHLYYQPLVEIESRRIIGVEALLRWKHPRRGMVSPAEFIPLAEETGLIVPIGEWVMRQACADACAWPETIKVAVNLSPIQFRNDGLVRVVTSALAASGLSPSRLELEITESVLLHDNESAVGILHKLRSLGVRISLDDFGTGYSSLSYLRSFPFDKIKIDQSFIRNITESNQSLAIVQAVTSLGATLGMVTTAEGVETVEQLDQLRMQGCKEVQGYYFSPPRPAGELEEMLGTAREAKGKVA